MFTQSANTEVGLQMVTPNALMGIVWGVAAACYAPQVEASGGCPITVDVTLVAQQLDEGTLSSISGVREIDEPSDQRQNWDRQAAAQ